MSVEPDLQPITGESFNGSLTNIQDGARLDIAVNGFLGEGMRDHWGEGMRDVLLDAANRTSNLASADRKHEKLKTQRRRKQIQSVGADHWVWPLL